MKLTTLLERTKNDIGVVADVICSRSTGTLGCLGLLLGRASVTSAIHQSLVR